MKTTLTLTTEKVHINFSSGLSESDKEFITDEKSKKLSQLEPIVIQNFCSELVKKCYLDIGQLNVSTEVAKQMIKGLIAEVKPYEHKISLFGLKTAITKGIRKEYGEYYGINSVSFNMFLKAYMTSTERANAIMKQRQHETKLANDRRAIETMDAAKEFTKYCYDKYKEQNVIWDPAQTAYDWLKKKGLIRNFTKELKNSIRAEAESRYMNFKMNGDNKGVPASQQVLDRIAGKPKEKLSYEQEITNLCKMLHLRIIFDQLTLEDIENVM